MKILKELAFYFLMLCIVIMLGSIWNVSKAQEVTAVDSKNGLSEIDIEIIQLRSELLMDFESETNELKLKEHEDEVIEVLGYMESRYIEEQRIIAEAKAKEEAKRKAREEAELKARKEAELKARKEAERQAVEARQVAEAGQRQLETKAIEEAKQRIIKAEEQQQTLYVEASAYTSGCAGCSGITAYGYDIRNTIYYKGMRVIAADTRILPFGTIVDIEGVGRAVVLDRGGAIKGNKIDVLVNSKSDAYSYGRRYNVKVNVVGKAF